MNRAKEHKEDVGGPGFPGREVSVTMSFVVAGIVWILFADYLLQRLDEKFSLHIPQLHILTGLVFVGVCGAAMFVVLHKSSVRARSTRGGLESLFVMNPIPMALISKDSFRVTRMNFAALQLFGLTGKEAGPRFLHHLVHTDNESNLEQLKLFMVTGMEQLGVWQFRHDSGSVFPAEVMISRTEYENALVATFLDSSEKTQLQQQLSEMTRNIQHQVNLRTRYLEHENEELAYRASQTEHVNNELILVNEQLQNVNRKVAAANERLQYCYSNLKTIISGMAELVCIHTITPAGARFEAEGKRGLLGADEGVLSKPWFWLDMVDCESQDAKEAFERMVLEKGEAINTFAFVTRHLGTRRLLVQVRMEKKDDQTTTLTTTFCDVTRLSETHEDPQFHIKTA